MNTSPTPPDLAQLFEELPDRIAEAVRQVAGVPPLLVDIKGVVKATSLARATVYRLVSSGDFPPPVNCPAGTRWRMADISSWVAKLKTR